MDTVAKTPQFKPDPRADRHKWCRDLLRGKG